MKVTTERIEGKGNYSRREITKRVEERLRRRRKLGKSGRVFQ
jgi:hypothetical protein